MDKLALFVVIMGVLTASVLAIGGKTFDFKRIYNNFHQNSLSPDCDHQNIKTLWIEQKLDHFDNRENRTWQMRYMTSDAFFKSGGPLFIVVNGQPSIEPNALQGVHFCDLAKEHNGYLFLLEHRFFGKSLPVDDMRNENMKYLSVRQALADIAHFIRSMKSTIPGLENSKTILAGCSYSGTLVTWFRKLYPELATGGWASSAPLLAKMNYYEYYELAGRSIKLMGGNACYDRIDRGIKELEFMFDNKRGSEAKAILGLCDTFNVDYNQDVLALFNSIAEQFAYLVQYHHLYNITENCLKIMEGSTDVVGVANFISDMLEPNNEGCINVSYEASLKKITDINFNGDATMRQWAYLVCSDLSSFLTSDSKSQPFGTKLPLQFNINLCADAFGDIYTAEYIQQKINDTNTMFGGVEVDIENVYWTHGELDPWIELGKQNGTHTTVIPYHSHCTDWGSITNEDAPALRASKEKLAQLVREWLA